MTLTTLSHLRALMSPPTIYSLSREIITHIALYLRESREDASARTALVSLATTCRYLSEPVLDVMWHTLPDVIPLLLALPADLCTITPEQPPLGPPYDRRKEFVSSARQTRRNHHAGIILTM